MAFSRTTALEYLRRAHKQNRLAHAYLISGPQGSGKQQLAADLASLVNGTPASDVFSAKAREIFVARPESKSRRIVIEQIRGLEHALHPDVERLRIGRRKDERRFPRITIFRAGNEDSRDLSSRSIQPENSSVPTD